MTDTRSAMALYKRRMLGSMLGYVGGLLGVTYFLKGRDVDTLLAAGLAFIPVIFIMGVLFAIWRYLQDTDEVQRFFLTRAMIFGLFAVLVVSGGWGLMEMVVDDLPKLPVFWIFPIFFLVMGLSQALNRDQTCLP